jgi:hypothetical protein
MPPSGTVKNGVTLTFQLIQKIGQVTAMVESSGPRNEAVRSKPVQKTVSGSKRTLQKARQPKAAKKHSKSAARLEAALEALRAADTDYRDRRSKYEQFLVVNRDRPSLDRAVAWLQFVAADIENYGDYEALIYLASQGLDVTRLIETVVDQWKNDEEAAIAASVRDSSIYDAAKSKTTYTNGMLPSEAPDIEHASEYLLREFWYGHRSQLSSLDATMLRTVEWCRIGGFERWWRRLARLTNENVIRGGIEAAGAMSYLFNMVRSNLALEIMPGAMSRMLEAVELRQDGEPPWISTQPFPGRKGTSEYRRIEDIGYAGALVFAAFRIRGKQARTALVEEACGLLQRTQYANGAWPMWLQKSSTAIEETAIATHALAIMKPLGWERQTRKATAWLLKQQDVGGYWREDSCPDPTYLTVLVLDALALGEGRNDVTFRASPSVEPRCGEKLSPPDTLDWVRPKESSIRATVGKQLEEDGFDAIIAAGTRDGPQKGSRSSASPETDGLNTAFARGESKKLSPKEDAAKWAKLKDELPNDYEINYREWMDRAKLTDKQYVCFSLRKEGRLSTLAISRRVGITRQVVDGHVERGQRKIDQCRANQNKASGRLHHS